MKSGELGLSHDGGEGFKYLDKHLVSTWAGM